MDNIPSASFNLNESLCLEETISINNYTYPQNKLILPDNCRIQDITYNHTTFLKNRALQYTTDGHYITLYRGRSQLLYTLYETTFNNDTSTFSMQ